MNIYEQFDVQVSQEAKTFPLSDDASIDLLPMGSDFAKRKFDQIMAPYQPRLNAGGKLTEEENKRLNLKFFSEVIVRGWRGLREAPTEEGKLGKEIKYTPEAAAKLFEALPRFFALVVRIASDEDSFVIEQIKADEGNS